MPWPDMRGKRVLDVGCDAGAWCWFADANGAAATLGLDRGRDVRGRGFVDVALENNERAVREGYTRVRFESVNLGREWPVFERFDLILVMSVYHHIFENCGDHLPIWFWLWRQCAADGQVLWEGPVDDRDPVVRANVSGDKRGDYTLQKILAAAGEYFTAEKIGPALHEPTREVWRFRPIAQQRRLTPAHMTSGAGGATAAFEYEGGRRIREIARILGMRPVAGSLNLRAERPFNWDRDYFRAQVLDVEDRSRGLQSRWAPRWARFYPLRVDSEPAFAFRFEGESYELRFMEIIADCRLREKIAGPEVVICR